MVFILKFLARAIPAASLLLVATTAAWAEVKADTQSDIKSGDADNSQHQAEAGSNAVLPETRVSAGRSQAVQGYNAITSTGPSRTETPVMELAQSVRVISREWLDDTRALRLADTVDYVSGIARLNDFGTTWDNFAIRGFSNTDQGMLINGFRGGRGYNVTRDAATVERFEFLKGPAAAVYGASEPGGIINIVTKKPKFTQANSLDVNIGSYGLRRAALDTTGPINEQLAYRLNVVAEDSAMRSSLFEGDRQTVAPALTWVISDKTVLNYEAEFTRVSTPLDRGLIQINGNPRALPRSRVLGEPNDGNVELTSQAHQLTLEHEFTSQWRARAGLNFKKGTFEGDNTELATFTPPVVNRRQMWRSLPMRDTSFQAELEGKLQTGSIGHTVLLGVEASRLWMAQEITRSNPTTTPYPLNIYNPVYYDFALPGVNPVSLRRKDEERAVFVQDIMALTEQLKLHAGVRYVQLKRDQYNSSGALTRQTDDNFVLPNVALVYSPQPTLSVYGSYAQGLEPGGEAPTGTTNAEVIMDPNKSRQLELGVKTDVTPDLSLSAAIFQIKRQNEYVDASSTYVMAGKQINRGIEFAAQGRVTRDWMLGGSFTALQAKAQDTDDARIEGKQVGNVPRYKSAVYSEYSWPGLPALKLNATWLYSSSKAFAPNNEIAGLNRKVDGYHVLNLGGRYIAKIGDTATTFRFGVDNVFNKFYWGDASSAFGGYLIPGAPRVFRVSAQIDF
ncbi:MAG: TonB-dependent siderophore receptor [Methylobacillus glycogenes]|nr:TonB-dependent siderophore receptor [Methylobacillus glycogenes]